MNLNLYPFAVLWAILALAVLTLLLIRKKIAAGEDDTLHVMDGDAGMVPRQKKIAHELELIDRWGKSLTVITECHHQAGCLDLPGAGKGCEQPIIWQRF